MTLLIILFCISVFFSIVHVILEIPTIIHNKLVIEGNAKITKMRYENEQEIYKATLETWKLRCATESEKYQAVLKEIGEVTKKENKA